MLAQRLIGASKGIILPSITYVSSANDESDLTTYNFALQDIGEPSADRLVIVGVSGLAGSLRTLVSGSIAGTTASIDVTTSAQFCGGIMSANVPSGSSGTISVTFSGGLALCSIVVWVATGLTSFNTQDTGTDSGANASDTLTTSADGVGVGIIRTTDSSVSWTNLTEDLDNFGNATYPVSAASGTFSGLSTTISVVNSSPSRMFAASWR